MDLQFQHLLLSFLVSGISYFLLILLQQKIKYFYEISIFSIFYLHQLCFYQGYDPVKNIKIFRFNEQYLIHQLVTHS